MRHLHDQMRLRWVLLPMLGLQAVFVVASLDRGPWSTTRMTVALTAAVGAFVVPLALVAGRTLQLHTRRRLAARKHPGVTALYEGFARPADGYPIRAWLVTADAGVHIAHAGSFEPMRHLPWLTLVSVSSDMQAVRGGLYRDITFLTREGDVVEFWTQPTVYDLAPVIEAARPGAAPVDDDAPLDLPDGDFLGWETHPRRAGDDARGPLRSLLSSKRRGW